MIACPAGCGCYRNTLPFMLLHLQTAHRWPVARATDWMVNHVQDAMDNGPS